MESLALCRICLNNNVQHVVKNQMMQEIYERLTTIPTDRRPLVLCYICYAQLRASLRFKLKCLRAEQLLAQMLDQRPAGDEALDPTWIDRSALQQFSITPVVIDSTIQGVYSNDTETLLNENDLHLEELMNDMDPLDVHENSVKLEVEIAEAVERNLNTGVYSVQDNINVANTEDIELAASKRNDNIEEDKTKIISKQDSKKVNMCQKKLVLQYTHDNDNASMKGVVGAKVCLSSEKRFICDKCKKNFSRMCDLKKHTLMRSCGKSYICDVCQKTFVRKFNLKSHLLSHRDLRQYFCDVCKKGFNYKSNLKIHAHTHTGEKPYVCNVCNKGFNTISDLKSHARTHTGEKPYICNVCKKSFRRRSHLNSHSSTHTGVKPYVCNVCKKCFTQSGHLKTHAILHSGENKKPYVCNVCNKGFTQSSTLKGHARTHTGEKPYVCSVCSKGFTHRTTLKTHERTHTGEKPYVCIICNKGFSKRSYLKVHERTHTGEKPYVCNICNRGFSKRPYLEAHAHTHIGEKP